LAELLAIPAEILWTFTQALQTKATTVWDIVFVINDEDLNQTGGTWFDSQLGQ
jgi:hypothetical protein